MQIPISFFGWYEFFEDISPMTTSEIMKLHTGWADLIKAGEFALIVKAIEEYHGIK